MHLHKEQINQKCLCAKISQWKVAKILLQIICPALVMEMSKKEQKILAIGFCLLLFCGVDHG